jgi:hypothetical protein
MSVASPCEICASANVEGACDRCGQLVCERHFEDRLGLCTECAADSDERPTVPGGEDRPDGVDTYRF